MGLFRKRKVAKAPAKAPANRPAADEAPPVLSPVTSLIIGDMAMRAGQALLRRGVETGVLHGAKAKGGRLIRGRTLRETLIGTALAQVARSSVPGAILVGGGIVAKALRDRRRASKMRADRNADA